MRNAKNSEAICFDFQITTSVLNILTYDVYYRHQVSAHLTWIFCQYEQVYFTFIFKPLATKAVCSMVHDFIYIFWILWMEMFDASHSFCDSWGGQNKNYTVIRFLHYENRFDEIKACFPMRGHYRGQRRAISQYMETHTNMGIISQKVKVELPNQLYLMWGMLTN